MVPTRAWVVPVHVSHRVEDRRILSSPPRGGWNLPRPFRPALPVPQWFCDCIFLKSLLYCTFRRRYEIAFSALWGYNNSPYRNALVENILQKDTPLTSNEGDKKDVVAPLWLPSANNTAGLLGTINGCNEVICPDWHPAFAKTVKSCPPFYLTRLAAPLNFTPRPSTVDGAIIKFSRGKMLVDSSTRWQWNTSMQRLRPKKWQHFINFYVPPAALHQERLRGHASLNYWGPRKTFVVREK